MVGSSNKEYAVQLAGNVATGPLTRRADTQRNSEEYVDRAYGRTHRYILTKLEGTTPGSKRRRSPVRCLSGEQTPDDVERLEGALVLSLSTKARCFLTSELHQRLDTE